MSSKDLPLACYSSGGQKVEFGRSHLAKPEILRILRDKMSCYHRTLLQWKQQLDERCVWEGTGRMDGGGVAHVGLGASQELLSLGRHWCGLT